jgi:hypothetical protein
MVRRRKLSHGKKAASTMRIDMRKLLFAKDFIARSQLRYNASQM